jgi:hypothetical protein
MDRVYGLSDVRAGIFYDNNDTTYYMDYNSTTSGRLRGNLIFNDYGAGIVGTYSDVRLQAVFAMGDAYKLAINGTGVGSLYGIAWSHPNFGGVAANLADHGMLILQNGVFRGAWGGGRLVTVEEVRGTLFRDYNDSGYYVDPNSNSRINNVFADRYFTQYNNFGDTINNAPWYGLGGSNIAGPFGGLMVQVAGYYGLRLRSANVILELDSPNYSTSWAWFSAPVAVNNQIRAHSFYDYNDTAYYVDPNADLAVRVYGEISNSNYNPGNMQPGALNIGRTDTNYGWDGTSWAGDIRAGILANCSELWEFVIHDSGDSVESVFRYDGGDQILMGRNIGWGTMYIEAAASFRAPIFYDSNDTGFFLDPNTTATSLRIAGGIKQNNLVGRPYAVWGASGSATGAVVIKFPGGSGN